MIKLDTETIAEHAIFCEVDYTQSSSPCRSNRNQRMDFLAVGLMKFTFYKSVAFIGRVFEQLQPVRSGQAYK